jgi:predicted regulator of Ras-like GTPase activity (Roadblock/LC7/MglB family)
MADPITPPGSTDPQDAGTGAPRASRAQAFRETLFELIRLDGVRGGLIVTPDGLVINSELPPRFPVEALAALAATLGRELELGASRLDRGAFRTAFFSADDGTVFLGGSGLRDPGGGPERERRRGPDRAGPLGGSPARHLAHVGRRLRPL